MKVETMTLTITNVPKDCTGRVIQSGDMVAVAQRRGSSSWINRYKVLRVDSDKGAVFQLYEEVETPGKKRPFYFRGGQQAVIVVGRVP